MTDGGALSQAADDFWLNPGDPRSLWRSEDTESWEQVGLERSAAPGPDGFAWTLQPGRPLTYDGVTIVPFQWEIDEWVVVRGMPGAHELRAATLIEQAPGVYDIHDWPLGRDDRGTFLTVRFEETEDGLRVIDHADGSELKVLEGVSMEFIKMLAHRFEGDDLIDVASEFTDIAWEPVPRLAIVEGSTLVEVEPPLEGGPYRQAYTVDADGFVSVTVGSDDLAHVHRSLDGREWREIEVLGDDPGEPVGFEVSDSDGTVQLHGGGDMWTLMDDLTWELFPPARSLPADPGFLPFASGWLLVPVDTDPVTGVQEDGPGRVIPTIWFQPAEGEPVPIDITEIGLPASAGPCAPDVLPLSPSTIAAGFYPECGVHEAWVITFDDVPA